MKIYSTVFIAAETIPASSYYTGPSPSSTSVPYGTAQGGSNTSDWAQGPAPHAFCTPTDDTNTYILGIAALQERRDKAWLKGDSAMMELTLWDHTCQHLLANTTFQASGYNNYDNYIRWDLNEHAAVLVSIPTMPTYQAAGYCPHGYGCTEKPSYWFCGPPGKPRTMTCSLQQGQLKILTAVWGKWGNVRQQLSYLWTSAAVSSGDACNCLAASSSISGLDANTYVYGCGCNLSTDMSRAINGEASTGCREEWSLGYCPPAPDPFQFQPTIRRPPSAASSTTTTGPPPPPAGNIHTTSTISAYGVVSTSFDCVTHPLIGVICNTVVPQTSSSSSTLPAAGTTSASTSTQTQAGLNASQLSQLATITPSPAPNLQVPPAPVGNEEEEEKDRGSLSGWVLER